MGVYGEIVGSPDDSRYCRLAVSHSSAPGHTNPNLNKSKSDLNLVFVDPLCASRDPWKSLSVAGS